RAFIFHRFTAFDWKLPMMPELVERVIHGLGLGGAHAAATHRVVKHAIAILPWPLARAIGDVVQHRSVAIFAFKRSTHDRPEVARNRCAIYERTDRRDPDFSTRISVAQFS